MNGRVEAEEQKRESERQLRAALLRYGSDIITILDSEATVLYASPSVQQALGRKPEEYIGENAFDLFHPDDVERVAETYARGREEGEAEPTEYRLQHADGSWRWFEGIGTNMLDEPGVEGIVINSRDITERKELERQLRHQSLHDPLTGLPNRTLFNDRLTQSLERVARSGESVAVMFLDLDDFKRVNDTLGHSAGDELLASMARRLEECLRSSDTVSRMGGDEFTVLLDEVEGEAETSEIARRIVDRFRSPFTLSTLSDGGMEREVSVTASLGVVLATPGAASGVTSGTGSGADGSLTADELLKWADTTLYQAKDVGKDHYLFFHPQMGVNPMEKSV